MKALAGAETQVRRRWLRGLLALPALAALELPWALAQGRPNKPVRWLVAYPPGGVSDDMSRELARRLALRWGVPVVVENRPGAGGTLAMERLARAAPDGHTLCFSAIAPLTLAPALVHLPYDPVADIAPVVSVMHTPVLLMGTRALGVDSLHEALALAPTRAGGLRWATSGMGTTGHLVLEQVRRQAGVAVTHIPYSGGGRQLHDAIAGHFDLLSGNAAEPALGHVAEGRLWPLAVGAPARLPALPAVPTLAELGFARANRSSEFAVFAPGRTPLHVLDRLNSDIRAVLTEPDMRQYLQQANHLPTGGERAELMATLEAERALALHAWPRPINRR
jgi:tripartite-type tricarboxylate transporter receptor subunit TctC